MLKAGADPDKPDAYGSTALMQVAWVGVQLEKLVCFLKYGAKPDAVNHRGETALIFACQEKDSGSVTDIGIVRELLNDGADPNHEDAEGKTALMYSKRLKDSHITDVIIKGARRRSNSEKQ